MRAIIEYLFPAVRMRREEKESLDQAYLEALKIKWEREGRMAVEFGRRVMARDILDRKLTALRQAARRPKPSRRVIS